MNSFFFKLLVYKSYTTQQSEKVTGSSKAGVETLTNVDISHFCKFRGG